MPERLPAFFNKLPWWGQWLVISVLALIIYAPIVNNSFLNDDFSIIKGVCVDENLNTNGFFRPLSDISIFLDYQLFHMNPAGYYLTGIFLHALSTLLLFHFCLRWRCFSNDTLQGSFALIAALLFLTYPFHNESVAWILGRGALMANLVGMAALLILVSDAKEVYKMCGVCLCYFVGLAIYESVIVLPALIILYILVVKRSARMAGWWTLFLGITFITHFILRYWVSGTITGEYGAGFFSNGVSGIVVNAFKVCGRMILPPMYNAKIFTLTFSIILVLLVLIVVYLWRQIKNNKQAGTFFLLQCSFLLIALALPFITSVSTHTSESDRFLHFPSYFFCILTAFSLVVLFKDYKWLLVVLALILSYQVYFLEKNNWNWRKASYAVRTVLEIIREHPPGQKVYVVNLPDEIDGAFVFRNGFKEALELNNMDTSSVVVVSQLKRDEEIKIPGNIQPQILPHQTFIPPFLMIENPGNNRYSNDNKIHIVIAKNEMIIYWNKERWVKL